MSKGVLDNLAEIRERRGLDPINPHTIEGFGDGMPPAPPLLDGSPIPSAAERYGSPIELDDETPFSTQAPQPPPPPPAVATMDALLSAFVAMNRVTIAGPSAVLDGHSTTLSDADLAQVERVVLGALQRDLRAKQAELAKLVPRRTRSDKGVPRAKRRVK